MFKRAAKEKPASHKEAAHALQQPHGHGASQEQERVLAQVRAAEGQAKAVVEQARAKADEIVREAQEKARKLEADGLAQARDAAAQRLDAEEQRIAKALKAGGLDGSRAEEVLREARKRQGKAIAILEEEFARFLDGE